MDRFFKYLTGRILSGGARLHRITPPPIAPLPRVTKIIPNLSNQVPNQVPKLISNQIRSTFPKWYGYAFQRLSTGATHSAHSTGAAQGGNPNRPNLVTMSMQWLPSSGVAIHMFGLHGIFPRLKRSDKPLQSSRVNFKHISPALRNDMEKFWPNLKNYGDRVSNEMFWRYQWRKHGVYMRYSFQQFFQAGVDFIKPLHQSFHLQVGIVTNIQNMLDTLKNFFTVSCGIVSDRVRGYIYTEQNHYHIRVLEEVRVSTDAMFVQKINAQNQLHKMASITDKIVLPKDPLYRHRSFRDNKDILYVPGQANYNLLLREEHVKQNTRESIYMNKDSISFTVVEDEQGVKKLGVLSICIGKVFNPLHDAFLRLLSATKQLDRILIVINRMELVNWQENSFNKLRMEIEQHSPMLMRKSAEFLPISNEDNIKEAVDKEICNWYDGGCLFRFLDTFEKTDKDDKFPLRLIIHNVESDLVIGEVVAGIINVQDDLVIMPEKVDTEVIAITIGDDPKLSAMPGDFVKLRLSCSLNNTQQGCVLSSKADPVALVYEFEVKFCQFDDLYEGEKLYLFIHYMEVWCKIKKISKVVDPVTKAHVVSGTIQVEKPVCIETSSKVPALGSFFLVRKEKIVGSGKVIAF